MGQIRDYDEVIKVTKKGEREREREETKWHKIVSIWPKLLKLSLLGRGKEEGGREG